MSPERFVKGESERTAKFLLIRLPLLTSHTPFCASRGPVLRPFCAQKYSTRN